MENQPRSDSVEPKSLSEALATILASMMGVAAVALLLEPEEIVKYTEGQMDFSQISGLMMGRLPNGGEGSAIRFTRAFGLRLAPEVMDRFFEALEMDGVPIDSWLSDLNDRVTALEETISQPARERDEE